MFFLALRNFGQKHNGHNTELNARNFPLFREMGEKCFVFSFGVVRIGVLDFRPLMYLRFRSGQRKFKYGPLVC